MSNLVAMTIAGSDPSGGAGLQADLKAFHQHGVYGTTVVTLFTVQNTQTVIAVETLEPRFVLAQLDAVLADIPPQAAKTGALGTAAVIEAVAERLAGCSFPLVVDPVMISKHGLALLDHDAAQVMRSKLLPHAYLVTPNSLEAAVLAEMSVEDQASMEKAAAAIAQMGPRHVLVKGGPSDRTTPPTCCTATGRSTASPVSASRPRTRTAAAASSRPRSPPGSPAARISRPPSSGAKTFVTQAIRNNPCLGRGRGPTNLHVDVPPTCNPQIPGCPSDLRFIDNASLAATLPTPSLSRFRTYWRWSLLYAGSWAFVDRAA